MKQARDVKFIIYQVLYIFVICIISLKGADINLEEVINKDVVVQKSFADSLKAFIDSLLALGIMPEIKFDTNKKYTPEDMAKLMAEINVLKVQVIPNITPQPFNPTPRTPDPIKPIEDPKKNESVTTKVVAPEFTQYTQSTIKNPYPTNNLEILADGKQIANIPPGGQQKITIMGESSVTFKVGTVSDTKRTKENQVPIISIQKVGSGGENASLRALQNTTGFRVIVTDDHPENLSITVDGPVVAKQVDKTTFDVTLQFLGSEQAFDSWSKGKDSPYHISFTVHVKDKLYSKHDIKTGGTFTFGKW
jgi:hypothetical protein